MRRGSPSHSGRSDRPARGARPAADTSRARSVLRHSPGSASCRRPRRAHCPCSSSCRPFASAMSRARVSVAAGVCGLSSIFQSGWNAREMQRNVALRASPRPSASARQARRRSRSRPESASVVISNQTCVSCAEIDQRLEDARERRLRRSCGRSVSLNALRSTLAASMCR